VTDASDFLVRFALTNIMRPPDFSENDMSTFSCNPAGFYHHTYSLIINAIPRRAARPSPVTFSMHAYLMPIGKVFGQYLCGGY
jgi:hypothetical protein